MTEARGQPPDQMADWRRMHATHSVEVVPFTCSCRQDPCPLGRQDMDTSHAGMGAYNHPLPKTLQGLSVMRCSIMDDRPKSSHELEQPVCPLSNQTFTIFWSAIDATVWNIASWNLITKLGGCARSPARGAPWTTATWCRAKM